MGARPKHFLGCHKIVKDGEEFVLQVFRTKYFSTPERVRIDLEDTWGCPFATLSVHVPRQYDLKPDEFVVKDEDWARQMLSFWQFQDTGRVDDFRRRPICRLWDSDRDEDDGEQR